MDKEKPLPINKMDLLPNSGKKKKGGHWKLIASIVIGLLLIGAIFASYRLFFKKSPKRNIFTQQNYDDLHALLFPNVEGEKIVPKWDKELRDKLVFYEMMEPTAYQWALADDELANFAVFYKKYVDHQYWTDVSAGDLFQNLLFRLQRIMRMDGKHLPKSWRVEWKLRNITGSLTAEIDYPATTVQFEDKIRDWSEFSMIPDDKFEDEKIAKEIEKFALRYVDILPKYTTGQIKLGRDFRDLQLKMALRWEARRGSLPNPSIVHNKILRLLNDTFIEEVDESERENLKERIKKTDKEIDGLFHIFTSSFLAFEQMKFEDEDSGQSVFTDEDYKYQKLLYSQSYWSKVRLLILGYLTDHPNVNSTNIPNDSAFKQLFSDVKIRLKNPDLRRGLLKAQVRQIIYERETVWDTWNWKEEVVERILKFLAKREYEFNPRKIQSDNQEFNDLKKFAAEKMPEVSEDLEAFDKGLKGKVRQVLGEEKVSGKRQIE